jgi:hypothetical protein
MIAANPSRCGSLVRLWPLGTALQMLGLALMVGGMLALGAFTAPVVFGQFPRAVAAPVMALIFRRYDIVLLVALGLLWLGEGLRTVVYRLSMRCPLMLLRLLIMVGLTGCLLVSTLFVNADIERMNRAGLHRNPLTIERRHFEAEHKQSESLYKVQLLLAILLILLTPFAQPNLSLDHGQAPKKPGGDHA